MKSKLISDLRKAVVKVLDKHDSVYHFDDSPEDIITDTGKRLFKKAEAEIIGKVIQALYGEELFLVWIDMEDKPKNDYSNYP